MYIQCVGSERKCDVILNTFWHTLNRGNLCSMAWLCFQIWNLSKAGSLDLELNFMLDKTAKHSGKFPSENFNELIKRSALKAFLSLCRNLIEQPLHLSAFHSTFSLYWNIPFHSIISFFFIGCISCVHLCLSSLTRKHHLCQVHMQNSPYSIWESLFFCGNFKLL